MDTTGTLPTPPTRMSEDALLAEAMKRLETKQPAPPSPTPEPEELESETASRSLLTRGRELWDSIGAGIAKAGLETKDFVFGEPEEDQKTEFRRGIERRAKELQDSSGLNSAAIAISQFGTGLLGAGKLTAVIFHGKRTLFKG